MHDTKETQIKSKSKIKRELLVLQELGRELLDISTRNLNQVPMTDSLREAILQARRFKKEALRRQIRHIGALIRKQDVEAIRQALIILRQPQKKEVQVLHEIESWRDRLLTGDDGLLDELCIRFANIDRQHLRQLLRNTKKEQALNKPPKSARVLFHYLKELQD